ncbi:MAG: GGDEF domain-containing protein, partial [Lachnospiraceae bacterium]|nr:GGDEF domain-containing protein [Lachnospiraceae bacterium]
MERDYLTNLPNRRSLYQYYLGLPQDMKIHAMFLDVDNFKKANDIHGHNMGDQLLVCIANFLQAEDLGFVARLGGDEFVILLDGIMPADQ